MWCLRGKGCIQAALGLPVVCNFFQMQLTASGCTAWRARGYSAERRCFASLDTTGQKRVLLLMCGLLCASALKIGCDQIHK